MEAVAIKPVKQSRMSHAAQERKRSQENQGGGSAGGATSLQNPLDRTLVDLCRNVIVAELERFPAHVFEACDEEEWENIIRLRHAKSHPKEGSGGLDGTGRVAPAVSDKFLREVEEKCPRLAESAVVDLLVWKDCTEFRYRRGGMTRPIGLYLPWPERVKQINEAGQLLQSALTVADSDDPAIAKKQESDMKHALSILSESPMNISLLQSTGIGKIVKKALKALKNKEPENANYSAELEQLLNKWMTLASDSDATSTKEHKTLLQDLETAESCQNWRQLFAALKQREDDRRSSQGKRMRAIRQNLATDRPKVVKVRPTMTAKQQRILAGSAGASSSSMASSSVPLSKLSLIKRDAIQSKQKLMGSSAKRGASFGDAVAFVSCVKKKKTTDTRKPTVMRALGGNKFMATPKGPPKALAAKVRPLPKPKR